MKPEKIKNSHLKETETKKNAKNISSLLNCKSAFINSNLQNVAEDFRLPPNRKPKINQITKNQKKMTF